MTRYYTVEQGENTNAKRSNKMAGQNESDSEVTVCRLGKIIQRISFAQSGASIRRVAWKWSGETRYQGAFKIV